MKIKARSAAFFAVLVLCTLMIAQSSTLTEQRVYDLFKAGVHTDELIRMIMSAPDVSFQLVPGMMDALVKAGIPEEVLKAMAARANGQTSFTTGSHEAFAPKRDPMPKTLPEELGVYLHQGDQWVEMMPEVVNWQSGGVVKELSTLFIVKGDVNGRIQKPSSKMRLTNPELLVVSAEGVAISEYQLIHLRTHSGSREFRTVTGGVFHVSGGAKRDTLDFESSRIAKRTYLVKLPSLNSGEYGLLPPGLAMANSASAQLGKMYTFAVPK